MPVAVDHVASPAAQKYLALKSVPGIGPRLARRLIERFGDIDRVLDAPAAQLSRIDRISTAAAHAVRAAREDEAVARELKLAGERGVRVICEQDDDYPAALKYVPDPPVCLYVAGTIRREDMLAVAVVGSRRCTRYGAEQAERFGGLLAGAGFTVVSGLARGVDGRAHHGALNAGGRTIAVLGNGLTDVYPPEHAGLAERVRQSGAVISELPMTTPPGSNHFEPRNRIIAGLSLGVLVVEAARKSGALITARLATADYNREVFAVPGRIDTPESAGTNALIREGQAKLVTCLNDVLDELGEVGRMAPFGGHMADEHADGDAPALLLEPDQQIVLDALEQDEADVERLADETELSVPRVMSTLMTLQLRGLVRELPGQRFVRARRVPVP